ncbi:flagellar M-ring protein FliF C-terminal domain-containing protein [Futiania mangrovi]|uniref:Flagellar M-ring protein n=1 Tax=Futiania mangrovi TaxID=2959716 RepID=A0A9J6PFN5_9PROT|nr:flagellar M-ring protein FliF C-terminal domain-containing protein [Futiania mangrovii]MCP1334922.1 hypothetical protein [Futiania mangrovii]
MSDAPVTTPGTTAPASIPPALRAGAIALSGLLGALIAVAVAWWVMMPARDVLFSNLAPRDLLQVTQRLGALGVAHEVNADTGTVLVARDRVDSVRLALAADAIPNPAGAGYATRDAASFRVSAGGQSGRAALEADLSRTLANLSGVHAASVHFAAEGGAPGATVVLDMLGAAPPADMLATVRSLVAGALAGLAPEAVRVVDPAGRAHALAETDGLVPADLRRKAFEAELAERARTLVARVVGDENVRVEVTADIRFASRTVTQNRLDPSGQVLTANETTATPQGEITGERATYEVTRTTETEHVDEGRVERMSVAVLVNAAALQDTPDAAALLSRIEGLVSDGIALDTARGDRITVESLPFAAPAQPIGDVSLTPARAVDWIRIAEIAGLAIVILAAIGLAFRAVRLAAAPGRGAPAAGLVPQRPVAPAPEAPSPAEGPRHLAYEQGNAAELGHDVGRLVQEHPDRAVALVRNWLHGRDKT